MQIVGITGQIGHGKSTLAKLLGDCADSSQQIESGQLVMDVANAWQAVTLAPPINSQDGLNHWISLLPPILGTVLHVDADSALLTFTNADEAQDPAMFEKLYQYVELVNAQPHLLKHSITIADKELYRPLLQWLGGYLVKMIGPGVWYDEIVRRLKQLATTDCELAVVTGLRFPGDAERIMAVGGVIFEIERPAASLGDQTDPTERERVTIPYQVTVFNDGSLAQLALLSYHLYQAVVDGQLQAVYHANSIVTNQPVV